MLIRSDEDGRLVRDRSEISASSKLHNTPNQKFRTSNQTETALAFLCSRVNVSPNSSSKNPFCLIGVCKCRRSLRVLK